MASTLTLTPCSPSSDRARARSVTSPSAVVATPIASLLAELEHHRGLLPPWHLGAPLRRRLYLHGMYPRAAPRPSAARLPGGVSPQYRLPPPSPHPGNSVKFGDGPTVAVMRPAAGTRIVRRRERRSELQVCADDIPSPPPPSLLRQFIDMFLLLPPEIFQRP